MSEDIRVFTAVSWRILNYYPAKGSRSLRRNTKTWKTVKVSTWFKISSSFQSTYLSQCPRPYLTSELKYSHLFTPTWNWAIKVILDKCIHEVWSAWMEKKELGDSAAAAVSAVMTWLMMIRDLVLNRFYRTYHLHFIYRTSGCLQY